MFNGNGKQFNLIFANWKFSNWNFEAVWKFSVQVLLFLGLNFKSKNLIIVIN